MVLDALTDPAPGGGGGKTDPDPAPDPNAPEPVELPALPENWQNGLPEGHRTGMEAYKDIPTLVKTLHHAQSMVGKDKVVIPGESATPEDWNTFYSKIGKPGNMEDYGKALELGEGLPKDTAEAFKKLAFENNLLPSQAKNVVEWLAKEDKDLGEKNTVDTEKRLEKEFLGLKGLWGEKYDVNLQVAQGAFKNLAEKVPGAWDWMAEKGLAGEPMMIQLFAHLGEKFGEGKLPGNKTDHGQSTSDVQKEINNIMADMKHAYHDASHPNHKIEVEEMQQRFARITPA